MKSLRARPDIRAALVLSLGFSSACQSGAPEPSEQSLATVEQEVLEATAAGNVVDVIVTLKGDDRLADLGLELERRSALVETVTERAFSALASDRAKVRWHGTFVPELSLSVDEALVSKLASLPMVESVVLDRKVHTMLSHGAPLIGATSTWLAGATGVGQTVAILDTGIDYTHPALGGSFGAKVVAGYDFINEDDDPMDDQGHGTGVAGIVASSDDTRRGIAPDAKLVALKVLGANGEGSFSAIDRALEWILTNASTFDISVANLSLGTDTVYDDPAICDGTNTAVLMGLLRAQGIPVFVASGNSGCGTGVSFPGCASNAIAVGAVYDASLGSRAFLTANGCGPSLCQGSPSPVECCADAATSAGKVTCYTNSSSLLDLLAPSHDAVTTQLGGGFQAQFGGTSAATPYAAGAAALLLDMTAGALSASALQSSLASTGSLKTDPKNSLSFPLINVFDAARSLNFCFGRDDGTPCDDDDACTAGDACLDNQCQGGSPADCDDDNLCTDDSCDAELGCVSEPNESPCSDGSACTESDVCHEGSASLDRRSFALTIRTPAPKKSAIRRTAADSSRRTSSVAMVTPAPTTPAGSPAATTRRTARAVTTASPARSRTSAVTEPARGRSALATTKIHAPPRLATLRVVSAKRKQWPSGWAAAPGRRASPASASRPRSGTVALNPSPCRWA